MRKILPVLICILIILHAVLLFYWGVSTFSTTLLFYLAIYVSLKFFYNRLPSESQRQLLMNNTRVLLLLLVVLEFFLLYVGKVNNTYYENKYGIYFSEYLRKKQVNTIQLLKGIPHSFAWEEGHPPFYESRHQSPDFDYPVKYNRLGLRGALPPSFEDSGSFRIVVLGDSYIEGSGTPEDSTFPVLLSKYILTVNGKKTEVINAGLCGSNPLYEIHLFYHLFDQHRVDLVLLETNITDILDVEYARGQGHPPISEYFCAVSRLFRIFYTWIFSNAPSLDPVSKRSAQCRQENITALVDSIQQFGSDLKEKKKCSLAVIYVPWRNEFPRGHDTDTSHKKPTPALRDALKTSGLPLIDLKEIYNTFFTGNKKITHYYWPRDGHPTPLGYDLMARKVAKKIKPYDK